MFRAGFACCQNSDVWVERGVGWVGGCGCVLGSGAGELQVPVRIILYNEDVVFLAKCVDVTTALQESTPEVGFWPMLLVVSTAMTSGGI